MKPIQLDSISPPQPNLIGGRSLLWNALMQNDMDAEGHQILNLDTSNLFFPTIPTQAAPPSNWYSSYDRGSMLFGFTQPNFIDIAGNLTPNQQNTITELGVVTSGTWRADQLLSDKLPTLDMIRAPINNVNLNSNRITNLADPINPKDAVTLSMLQQLAGQNPKAAVRAATTGPISTFPPVGLLTIDGVALANNDRVLVKDQDFQTVGYENGIWVAHSVGSVEAPSGTWVRSSDFDDPSDPPGTELLAASVFVLAGTANIGTTWFMDTPAPVYTVSNPRPDYPHFILISSEGGGGTISAGPGLQLVSGVMSAVGTASRIHIGTGIDIDPAYVGQGSITTLGTIATGVWHGSIISPQYGGTGVNNNPYTVSLAGNFSTVLGTSAPAGSPLQFQLDGPTSLGIPVAGRLATLAGAETFTNKQIDASQITGTLPVAHGGTGGTTPLQAMLELLPPQTPAVAGKQLTTDGAGVLSWT
jgi:hypothetical protein